MKTYSKEIKMVRRGEWTIRDLAIAILEDTPALEVAEALAEMMVDIPTAKDNEVFVSNEAYEELQRFVSIVKPKPKDPRGRKPKDKTL